MRVMTATVDMKSFQAVTSRNDSLMGLKSRFSSNVTSVYATLAPGVNFGGCENSLVPISV